MKNLTAYLKISTLCFLLTYLYSCGSSNNEAPPSPLSKEAKILRMVIEIDGTAYEGEIKENDITFVLPSTATNISTITALNLSSKASAKMDNTVLAVNKKLPALTSGNIKITVTAEDGTSKTYTIKTTVLQQSSDKQLTALTLTINNNDYVAVIDETAKTATLSIPAADAGATTSIVKIITTSTAATASVSTSANLPLTNNSTTVTITAEDASEQAYTLVIKSISSDKQLTALTLTINNNDYVAVIDETAKTATLSVSVADAGATTSIVKIITTSTAATASVSASANLPLTNNSATITITAEDGTSKTYTIKTTAPDYMGIIVGSSGHFYATINRTSTKQITMFLDNQKMLFVHDGESTNNDGTVHTFKSTNGANTLALLIKNDGDAEVSDIDLEGHDNVATSVAKLNNFESDDKRVMAFAGFLKEYVVKLDSGVSKIENDPLYAETNKEKRLEELEKRGKILLYESQLGILLTNNKAVTILKHLDKLDLWEKNLKENQLKHEYEQEFSSLQPIKEVYDMPRRTINGFAIRDEELKFEKNTDGKLIMKAININFTSSVRDLSVKEDRIKPEHTKYNDKFYKFKSKEKYDTYINDPHESYVTNTENAEEVERSAAMESVNPYIKIFEIEEFYFEEVK